MQEIFEFTIGYLIFGFFWLTAIKGLDPRRKHDSLPSTWSADAIVVLTWPLTLFVFIVKFIKHSISK